MKTIIILSIAMVLMATTGIVGAKALYDQAKHPEYKIVRDTAYIDTSKDRKLAVHEYQLELGRDSVYVYEGQRLVSVMHYDNSNIDSVLIKDNE